MIHYIDELDEKDLKGKRVLCRVDLNVPVVDGKIEDEYRIEQVVDTIDFLRQKEAQTILIAHCEYSAGASGVGEPSLEPMWNVLKGYFPVEFSKTYFDPEAVDKVVKLQNKEILLFENLRINPGEKKNDSEFAKKLSQMADIYVNDAFSVSHREHASVVGVPKFLPHYGGLLLRQEIDHLSKVFNPQRPFVFILGGAKFETKLPLIQKYLDKADKIFVGGALVFNIYKEMGFEIGKSKFSEGDFGIKQMLGNSKLAVPEDVTTRGDDGSVAFKNPAEVLPSETIVDSGVKTIEQIKRLLNGAKTIVWNGPLGNYEIGFEDKTEQLAEAIAAATAQGAVSIVGGGDTLASIKKLGLLDKFSFVSTGGGAMLDFLVNETLPGIEALEK